MCDLELIAFGRRSGMGNEEEKSEQGKNFVLLRLGDVVRLCFTFSLWSSVNHLCQSGRVRLGIGSEARGSAGRRSWENEERNRQSSFFPVFVLDCWMMISWKWEAYFLSSSCLLPRGFLQCFRHDKVGKLWKKKRRRIEKVSVHWNQRSASNSHFPSCSLKRKGCKIGYPELGSHSRERRAFGRICSLRLQRSFFRL